MSNSNTSSTSPPVSERFDPSTVAAMRAAQIDELPPAVNAPSAAASDAAARSQAEAAASSTDLPWGSPRMASSRSSRSSDARAAFPSPLFPLASLPMPGRPLLSRGIGRSSSHLSLMAIDPETSVLDPAVLLRMKLQFVKAGCGATATAAAADAAPEDAAPLPPEAPGMKKRRSARSEGAGSKGEHPRHTPRLKKQKTLPLVPKASLLTLDKQLSRERPSAADQQLAAFAFARHLVDWAAELDIDLGGTEDEDDSDGEESAAVDDALPHTHPSAVSDRPPSEWLLSPLAREESDPGLLPDFAMPDGASSSSSSSSATSTPFEPEMARVPSSHTLATHGMEEEAEAEAASQEGGLFMPEHFGHEAPVASSFLTLSPLPSPCSAAAGPFVSPLWLSPLASPKSSPELLAHLASPDERAPFLDLRGEAQPVSGAPLLASTLASDGTHIALLQRRA